MQERMPYAAFLDAVIDDGVSDARAGLAGPGREDALDGALSGFEACRGLQADALLALRDAAAGESVEKARARDPRRRWFRERAARIEWVLSVVNGASLAQGLPINFPPSSLGTSKAAGMLGLAA